MSDMPVNINKLNEMKDIMGEVFDQLIPAFIDQSDELISAMPALLKQNKIDVLERHAHSMKSSSLNVGAENLSEIARILEDMSRNKNDTDLLDKKIQQITDEYSKVKTTLNNIIR